MTGIPHMKPLNRCHIKHSNFGVNNRYTRNVSTLSDPESKGHIALPNFPQVCPHLHTSK